MKNIEEEILNLTTREDRDLETSLALIAEAGNLLLYENTTLNEIFEQVKTYNFQVRNRR